LDEVLQFAATMENIGDVISHGLSRLAIKRLDRGVRFSSIGHGEIESIHREVLSLLRSEINQFLTQNEDAASRSRKSVSEIKVLCSQSISRHRRRLSDHKTSSIGTSSIHQDTIRDLLQITFLLEPYFNLD
jgi:phosphate:Na+ symporter